MSLHCVSEWPLSDQDNVIQTIMKWGTWPLELCRDNCLCLKPNFISDNLSIIVRCYFLFVYIVAFSWSVFSLQCSDTVGWVTGRAFSL